MATDHIKFLFSIITEVVLIGSRAQIINIVRGLEEGLYSALECFSNHSLPFYTCIIFSFLFSWQILVNVHCLYKKAHSDYLKWKDSKIWPYEQCLKILHQTHQLISRTKYYSTHNHNSNFVVSTKVHCNSTIQSVSFKY